MERQLPIPLSGDLRSTAPSLLQSLGLLAVGLLFFGAFSLPGEFGQSVGQRQNPAGSPSGFQWQEVETGYAIGRYELSKGNKVLKSEVVLLRFSPERFSFHILPDTAAAQTATDLRTLTMQHDGVAGINANFFDEKGSPLGLMISNGEQRHRMHKGGRLLTGVFFVFGDRPYIVHRDDFSAWDAQCALQAGPRLIVNGKAVKVSEPHGESRRSGIAVTRSGAVIIYATFLRFPGATLEQIQQMLLDPALDVSYALNLDGGGSSQLFIKENPMSEDDTFITGGDKVPAGLIVRRKG